MDCEASISDFGTFQYQPLPSQQRFHTDLLSRYKGFSGPIGSGKSKALAYEAIICAALNPGCLGLIGAPTYSMLRDATQRAIFSALDDEGIEYEYHKQADQLRFKDDRIFAGSEIIFRSLETLDRLRGTNLAWFGIDELTYCNPAVWPILEGRLRDPRAWQYEGFAVWTPKGFDWVYDRFIREGGSTQYRAVVATAKENSHLPTDFYEALRASYDERLFAQEVLGEYLSISSGRAYFAFSDSENVANIEREPGTTILWSLDFNINPMCSVLAQRVGAGSTEQLQVLDEIVLSHSNTREACDEFHQRVEPWARSEGRLSVVVHGDPAGNSRQHATGSSDYDIVKNFFREHAGIYRAEFQVKRAHSPVRERVNATNALLCDSTGERRLKMSPRCKHLIEDYRRVIYLDGAGAVLDKSDPKRTHLSDAAGYLVEALFPLSGAQITYQRKSLF